jgi:hypothetical protein
MKSRFKKKQKEKKKKKMECLLGGNLFFYNDKLMTQSAIEANDTDKLHDIHKNRFFGPKNTKKIVKRIFIFLGFLALVLPFVMMFRYAELEYSETVIVWPNEFSNFPPSKELNALKCHSLSGDIVEIKQMEGNHSQEMTRYRNTINLQVRNNVGGTFCNQYQECAMVGRLPIVFIRNQKNSSSSLEESLTMGQLMKIMRNSCLLSSKVVILDANRIVEELKSILWTEKDFDSCVSSSSLTIIKGDQNIEELYSQHFDWLILPANQKLLEELYEKKFVRPVDIGDCNYKQKCYPIYTNLFIEPHPFHSGISRVVYNCILENQTFLKNMGVIPTIL